VRITVEDRWLTTEELAERMHTVPSTVHYWKHRGFGPPGTRFGRRTLYKLADVVRWEKQREAEQRPARTRANPGTAA
jgi:DNA-binding transcriptional MerR regulator